MSAKARGRVSPATEGKPKVRSRPQSCRQPGGKDGVMTANFPSRNCKNIMELLTEADTENLDFLNHKDNVLPSKPFKGRSLINMKDRFSIFSLQEKKSCLMGPNPCNGQAMILPKFKSLKPL